jgi:hypothetical protein
MKENNYLFENKKSNRFIVNLPEEFKINPYFIFEVKRPTVRISHSTNRISNSTNILIDDITLKIYDPIGPSTSQAIMQLFKPDETGKILINNTFDFSIELLEPTGVVVEKWLLTDCNIISVDFGSLTYKDEFDVVCEMKIKVGNFDLLF